ncbi:MAG: DUF4037 domain-containing protein [Chloroflexota bacterium]|nr:MAG: DUF4037 domain-containing protein [Chloroflexota bacterium]
MPGANDPEFIPGLELCEGFFQTQVRPILDDHFPGLAYSAALIGKGSEVLGFDTEMSRDHDWGPRAMLFLNPGDWRRYQQAVFDTLQQKLPASFRGYPTHFVLHSSGARFIEHPGSRPLNPRIDILSLPAYFMDSLGYDISTGLEPADWLTFPEQKLLGATRGAVFHDQAGLQSVRDQLSYYPHDVWLYLLAAAWTRIGQEEHLLGRAGSVGDEIGSILIASRLVRDLMRLCFLMEKQYAPYPKWFGSAFLQLGCAHEVAPRLHQVLTAEGWQERQQAFALASEPVIAMHNQLDLTSPFNTQPAYFHDRPFLVIDGGRIAAAIIAEIHDPDVSRISAHRVIGSIDEFSDNTDLLCDTRLRPNLRKLFT